MQKYIYSVLSGEIRALVKRLDDYYSQHKKLKKKVNRLGKYIEERVDCLKDDVDELLAMGHCNCSKKTINSSSEETITIMEGFEEYYAPPEKKIRRVKK